MSAELALAHLVKYLETLPDAAPVAVAPKPVSVAPVVTHSRRGAYRRRQHSTGTAAVASK